MVINGITYSANVPTDVTALTSLLIPTDENGTPSWSISADPEDVGASVVAFSFKSIDNAGTESTNTGTATLNLTAPLTISGSVLNDANGLSSPGNTVDGTPIQSASGTPLHANLFTSAGVFVATVPVDASGNYSLPASANTDYVVTISSTPATSSSTPATSVGLPAGWVNTGEKEGAGAGSDGTPDGLLAVSVGTSSPEDANFGINREPNTVAITPTLASQPSANQELSLDGSDSPLMNGSDPEDGTYTGNGGTVNDPSGVVITSLPTNGELWYDGFGIPVLVSQTDVDNGTLFTDPSLFSIVLTGSGYTSTTFEYAYVDAAGVVDPTSAEYTISWQNPLPVTLISFNVLKEGQTANLKWATSSEANSKGFEIQRSGDAASWTKIGYVESQNSNSSSQLTYHFNDVSPLQGKGYYRLKMVDLDASFAYSRVVSVDIKGEMVYVLPNPTSGTIKLSKSNLSEVKKVELVNTNGQVVYKAKQIPAEGINVKGLVSNGAYVLRVNYADGTQSSHKIVINN